LGAFRRLAWKLVGLGVVLGACGVLLAAWAGGLVLRVAYRPAFESHAGLLLAVMTSAIFVYVAVVLGYVITSARSFLSQLPLQAAVAATSAGTSWLLVPSLGLKGAAAAVAAAACVQICGGVLILRRALVRAETA
jgi:O-antigen/teichoic acid export membrane protein